MKTLVFAPGRVRSLVTYLEYFFLRFPGSLGEEESWELECVDTYDRSWTRRGQIWIRRSGVLSLVSPPSLFSENDDAMGSFGLQAPQTLGKVIAKVRLLSFVSDRSPILGHLVKVRGHSFLVLRGKEDVRWRTLEAAITADGLEPVVPGSRPLIVHHRQSFIGPKTFGTPLSTDPAGGFLLERLTDGLRVAQQYERGIRRDVDTECLHQYRVHLRRVRSLASLGLFWETLPEWARLKTVLKTLQQNTNELRDLDVLLLDLPELAAQLPWGEGERLSGWEQVLKKRRESEWRRVRAWLGSEDYHFAWTEISGLLVDLAGLGSAWTAQDLASSAFRRSARGLRRSLKGLESGSPDGALHEVRIRAKRLRYSLDGLGSLGPPPIVRTLLSTLKQTQEGLGRFQDRSVLLERLMTEREVFRSGRVKADTLSFGILVGLLVGEHQRQKQNALADCRKLSSKTFIKALEALTAPVLGASDEQ